MIAFASGWIYFLCWSICHYPQIWKNWKRKSVIGLSLDYISFMTLGQLAYMLYMTGMYFSKIAQLQYFAAHPGAAIPVEINDVLVSVHNMCIGIVLIYQCIVYEVRHRVWFNALERKSIT